MGDLKLTAKYVQFLQWYAEAKWFLIIIEVKGHIVSCFRMESASTFVSTVVSDRNNY